MVSLLFARCGLLFQTHPVGQFTHQISDLLLPGYDQIGKGRVGSINLRYIGLTVCSNCLITDSRLRPRCLNIRRILLDRQTSEWRIDEHTQIVVITQAAVVQQ